MWNIAGAGSPADYPLAHAEDSSGPAAGVACQHTVNLWGPLKSLIKEVVERVDASHELSEVLRSAGPYLPAVFLLTPECDERTGRLEETLRYYGAFHARPIPGITGRFERALNPKLAG